MNIRDIRLNLKHIDLMKHTLGLTKEKFKNKRYDAYRNYYATPNPEALWEELVDMGLAVNVGTTYMNYRVSEIGIAFLEDLFEIKIIE